MKTAPAVAVFVVVGTTAAYAQLGPTCATDSPERTGGIGCTIIDRRELPDLKSPVLWHIDEFETLEAARAAAGVTGVAFAADGTVWLLTIESDSADHHGGKHVTAVGPLPLPPAAKYALQVQAAAFAPGMYSVIHHHSGVEAIYVIAGEACYETPPSTYTINKGETLVIPAGTLHRAVVSGSELRHVFAIIVHDAAQPATTPMTGSHSAQLAACR